LLYLRKFLILNEFYMAFKKQPNHHFKKQADKAKKAEVKPAMPKAPAGPLMDPVLYVGDLDLTKYPRLEQKQDDRNIQEVENPLNQRR
jgi:hypothetical protein